MSENVCECVCVLCSVCMQACEHWPVGVYVCDCIWMVSSAERRRMLFDVFVCFFLFFFRTHFSTNKINEFSMHNM